MGWPERVNVAIVIETLRHEVEAKFGAGNAAIAEQLEAARLRDYAAVQESQRVFDVQVRTQLALMEADMRH